MPRSRKKPITKASPPATEPVTSPETDPIRQEPAAPELNGHEPSFAARMRPDGPRVRTSDEERATYSGKDVRVTAQDDSYFVEVKTPLSDQVVDGERMFLPTAKQDMLVAAGFDDISDRQNGSLWQASKTAVHRSGRDINVLAIELDNKGTRLGWTR